jgi:thiol-disulfide isomerase/thioredoxin
MQRFYFHISIVIALLLLTSFRCGVNKPGSETEIDNVNQVNPVIGLNLGNKAPEITSGNPYGEVISLSSLKGKLVLIDFWASWCGPCRHENPSIVEAYNEYKSVKFKGGNGFTVFSVSLDTKLDAWRKAIEKDGLIWEYHVSDLQGWNSEAGARYAVTSIPVNFLINENGIIIARNLRGEELKKLLEKLAVK